MKIKSIALKIAIYAGVVVLVICVGLGIISYNDGASAVIEEVEKALLMQAEQAREFIESRFEVNLAILETIASRPDVNDMNWWRQQRVLQTELERLPQFLELGIVTPDGSVRYSDNSTAELGDRDYVITAFSGQNAVSDLIASRVTNSLVLMYAVPIKNNDEVVGVLIARRDGTALSDITDELGFGEHGWAYIINEDGVLFAYPDRDLVQNQVNILSDEGNFGDAGQALTEIGLGKLGVIRYGLEDGSNALVGLAPIPEQGWTVGIGALESDILTNVDELRVLLIVVSVALIGLGVVAAVFLGRQVANPLKQVQEVIEAVAAGDLTQEVHVKTQDEVGMVALALNKTIASMREAIGMVSSATIDLAGTSEEMAAASQEVSASVEEVASTTNQFASTLDGVNENAQTVNNTVQGVSSQAAHGEQALKEIVEWMTELGNNTQVLAEEVGELGSLSDQIGNIVNVISAIAEQTNLLALNAAIEAARAGEHGRGFAVVADEVRTLAEQSANATSEITSLIGQIQNGISTTVTGMNEGASHAQQALTSVDESGRILHSILEAVESAVVQVQEISSGLAEINNSGHEIASATEEQAASMEQVASSAQDLTDMGTKLSELVKHFKITG